MLLSTTLFFVFGKCGVMQNMSTIEDQIFRRFLEQLVKTKWMAFLPFFYSMTYWVRGAIFQFDLSFI